MHTLSIFLLFYYYFFLPFFFKVHVVFKILVDLRIVI
jgi:hypothetical protein